MTIKSAVSKSSLGQLAVLLLASAIGIPALAQQSQPAASAASQSTASSTAQDQSNITTPVAPPKEGFWGRVYPFARKKWVKRQTDPINDRLTELDEVNAKNARDIQDVDGRAQAGISRAQSAADAANQTATAASATAQEANTTAQNAAGHVDQLNTTVNGLDQYHQITEAEVRFHGSSPVLTSEARDQLDQLAVSANGQKGYIVEIEAHSPLAGSSGIQSSERLAEAVKRYLVTEHEIPVYRMHAVALGNARSDADGDDTPIRHSSVHIRLMANSLAAQGTASPQSAASLNGAARP